MQYNPKLSNKSVLSAVKKLCDEANRAKALSSNNSFKKAAIEAEFLGIMILAHKLGICIGLDDNGQYTARWYKSKAEMDNWTDVMYI